MTKLDVRVPRALVERIDEEYERRGYTSRSEAIRDALRAWIDPPVRLSDEVLEELATSRRQVERGETTPLDELAGRYGVDLDESAVAETDVEIASKAEEHVASLDPQARERVVKKLAEAREWTEHRLERLSGYPYSKLRAGDHRAIISWDREHDVRSVEAVGHRRNVNDRHLPPWTRTAGRTCPESR